MEDIIDIIVTETTNTIEITSQSTDEIIDVNIIDNREDVTLNVTPTVVEININSLTGNFGVAWGEITGTLASQTDLNTALGLKADLVGGKVPSSQLPSYVDDIVEVANYAALPATGETGKIYVVLDTNKIYRWSGSAYVEIIDSAAVWGAITGTLSSQTDLQSALNNKVPYTGATGAVNLGAYDLKVNELTVGKGTSGLSNNTALGHDALFHISTGNYNTGVGHEALHNTSTGAYNTAIGQSALFTNTTGGQNTAIGLNALLYNTSGGSNTALGLDSLQHNTTGSSNVALGYNAGSHITGGSTPNTTSGTSIYIGRDTRANADGGANEIVIGHATTGNGSNTVTIGNSSVTANYLKGSVNAGSFVKSGGTSAQFLKADGSVDSTAYLPLTGGTLSGQLNVDSALRIKSGSATGILLETYSTNELRVRVSPVSTTYDSNLVFPSASRTFTFPNATGTLALTSDLSAYQPLLTNPVTGTGTSGIVAKFNGTSTITDSIIYDNGTRVSIGADVTTSNKFVAVASTSSSYAVVAQASGSANGFWATLSGSGEIFRGQTAGGSYFIINNGGNAFLNGNLNVGDFASTSYRLNVVGTANLTGALSIGPLDGQSIKLQASTSTGSTFQRFYNSAGTARGYLGLFWSGSADYMVYDAGSLQMNFNSSNSFTFTGGGAATFNGSLAVGTNLTVGSSSGGVSAPTNILMDGTYRTGGAAFDALKLYLYKSSTETYGLGLGDLGDMQYWAGTTSTGVHRFFTSQTERMRITSAGNVGINTTFAPGPNGLGLAIYKNDYPRISFRNSTTGDQASGGFQFYLNGNDFYQESPGATIFANGGTERMRITSGGWVLIGQTSVPAAFGNAVGVAISQGGGILAVADSDIAGLFSRRNSNGDVVYFRRDTTTVGSISVTTSSTSYNTSSDYRLKQDLKPFSGLNLVNQINAYDYEWKSDNTRSFGVLAHELANVLPYAVQGEKDGKDMQSVDYSKIVPVLIQAIKDQQVQIEQLKNK